MTITARTCGGALSSPAQGLPSWRLKAATAARMSNSPRLRETPLAFIHLGGVICGAMLGSSASGSNRAPVNASRHCLAW